MKMLVFKFHMLRCKQGAESSMNVWLICHISADNENNPQSNPETMLSYWPAAQPIVHYVHVSSTSESKLTSHPQEVSIKYKAQLLFSL